MKRAALLTILLVIIPLQMEAAPPEVTQGGAEMGGEFETPPHVGRAQFTSAIRGREPVDELRQVEADHRRIYYFTELRGLEGRSVSHRWEYQGRVMAEVFHQIDAPRWRA